MTPPVSLLDSSPSKTRTHHHQQQQLPTLLRWERHQRGEDGGGTGRVEFGWGQSEEKEENLPGPGKPERILQAIHKPRGQPDSPGNGKGAQHGPQETSNKGDPRSHKHPRLPTGLTFWSPQPPP